MPRIPGAEELGGTPSGRSGRPIATVDATQEARAIQSFGRQVYEVGENLIKRRNELRGLEAERQFQDFAYSEQRAFLDAKDKMPPGATNFASSYAEGYKERADAFAKGALSGLPPDMRSDFDRRLFGVERGLYFDAAQAERNEQSRYGKALVTDGINKSVLPRAANLKSPDEMDGLEADANKLIDANQNLTPVERDEMKRDSRERIELSYLSALPPEARYNALVQGSHAADIIRQEEGFRGEAYYDVNAHRVGYGSDTVTRADGRIERVGPNTTVSRGDADRDLNRRVGEFAAGAAVDIGQDAWNALPDNVRGPLISVAYNYGSLPKSVVNAAKSGDVDAIASAVEKLDANPERRAREAALIRGEQLPSSSFKAIPFEKRAGLITEARGKMEENLYNDLLTRINDGQAGDREIEAARKAGWLRDAGDIERARKAVADTVNFVGAAKAFTDPNYRFNSFDKDDQKRVDLIYERGPLAGGAGLLDGDPNAVQGLRTVVERTDTMPDKAKEKLQTGLWTGTREERRAALTILDGLYRERPDVVSKTFTERDLARLDEYQQLAGLYTPQEIDERFDPVKNPQVAERQKKLHAEGEKLVKDVDINTILDAFDPGIFTTGPSQPPDANMLTMLLNDYRAIFAESYSVAGNPERAKQEALKRLKDIGKWGVTDVGEGRYLTPYPPEAFYPAVDDSHDWMDEQLADLVRSKAPAASSWSVVSLPETESVVQYNRTNPNNQQPVPYGVGIVDGDGLPHILTVDDKTSAPMVVAFDYAKERDKKRGEFEQGRSALGPRARIDEDALKAVIPAGHDFTEGANPPPLFGGAAQ